MAKSRVYEHLQGIHVGGSSLQKGGGPVHEGMKTVRDHEGGGTQGCAKTPTEMTSGVNSVHEGPGGPK